jgi:hypothetical protein
MWRNRSACKLLIKVTLLDKKDSNMSENGGCFLADSPQQCLASFFPRWYEKVKFTVLNFPCRYPADPKAGTRKPEPSPKIVTGESFVTALDEPDEGSDDFDGAPLDDGPDWTPSPGFEVPGCGDRDEPQAKISKPLVVNNPKCDDKNNLSGVPYNLFHGPKGDIYKTFCSAADGKKEQLTWNVDPSGAFKNPYPLRRKRTPPPNTDMYRDYNFSLSWEPKANYDGSSCVQSCVDAFTAIVDSPCGHQGSKYCKCRIFDLFG